MSRKQTIRIHDVLSVRPAVWPYLTFLLLALATLALTAWAALLLWAFPYDGMWWSAQTGHVDSVDPGGPAAQAGIQAGDRVLALDGVPLAHVYPLYDDKQAGDQVVFTLSRAERSITTSLTLTVPPLSGHVIQLEPLLVALAFWGVGLVVWALCPFHGVTRIFFLLSQVVAGMLAVGGLSAFRTPWAMRLFNLLLLLLAPLALHFYVRFPQPLSARHRHPLLRLTYGAAGCLALTYLLLTWSPADPAGPPWLWMTMRSFVALTLLVALALLFRARRAAPLHTRRQRRLLIAGMVSSLLPLLLLSFLPDLVGGSLLLDYVWTFPFLILLPLSYGYAVRQGELGRADLILNRSLVYLILTVLLLSLYASLFLGLDQLLPVGLWSRPLVGAGLAVVVAAIFGPLRERLQRGVDRLFYGGWYDHRTAAVQITQGLEQITDPTTLAETVSRRLRTTLRLECACLLLAGADGEFSTRGAACETCAVFGQPETSPSAPPAGNALSRYFWRQPDPVESVTLRQALSDGALSEEERHLVGCERARVWAPICGRERVLGVLVLGSRRGDEALDPADFSILRLVARQVGAAARNLQLLAELQRRAAEVDRLHGEVLRAREEERKWLARELHDEVIQALVGLNHALARLSDGQAAPLQGQVHQIVDELRRTCRTLRPPALENLGLVPAVRSYLRELRTHDGVTFRIELHVEGDEEQWVPAEAALCLFRVLQEAMVNVQKHAAARRVAVHLQIRPDEATLTVEDDGRGFVVPRPLGRLLDDNHFGLVGTRERLELVHGSLQVTSAPGHGTRLHVRIPLSPTDQSL